MDRASAAGSSATSSESGRPRRREQLEQLREARDRVVGGQELGEDVAAADRAREDDASSAAAACVRSVSEFGVRTISSPSPASSSTLLVTVTGKATLPSIAAVGEQAHVEQQRLVDRHLVPLLVDEVEPLARLVEDGAEVGADRRHEPLRVADRLRERLARRRAPRRRSRARRPPRRRAGRRRAAARTTRPSSRSRRRSGSARSRISSRVERVEQVLGVALADAGRVRDRADAAGGDAPELLAREVLLDLLLQRRREQDPRRLVEADEDGLGIEVARADVDGGGEGLRLQDVPADRRRRDAQVGDVDAGRRSGPRSSPA